MKTVWFGGVYEVVEVVSCRDLLKARQDVSHYETAHEDISPSRGVMLCRIREAIDDQLLPYLLTRQRIGNIYS